jgi:hypothetical protein
VASTEAINYEWESIDLEFEAWRHSVLCILASPLSRDELRAIGVSLDDLPYYKQIYIRFAPSELRPIGSGAAPRG